VSPNSPEEVSDYRQQLVEIYGPKVFYSQWAVESNGAQSKLINGIKMRILDS